MSVNVSYKKQSLFLIISIIILFAVVESSARFYEFFIQDCNLENSETLNNIDYFMKRQICYDQQNVIYSYHPVDTIVPNQHFNTININNNGFRGPELLTDVGDEHYRIFMIGGSTIFGSGLTSDKETIPYKLHEKVNENYDNVEVINAGISSITSFEELFHIKNNLINLDPDMIIIYDGVNDIGYQRTTEPEIKESDDELKLKNFQKFLRSPVVVYRNFILPLIHSEPVFAPGLDIAKNQNDDILSNKIALIWNDRMHDFCEFSEKNNFESVIIIQPALYYGNKPLSDYEKSIVLKNEFGEKTFQKMIEYSKNMNNCSLVLNFSNVLENSNENLYIDQVHINDVGHEIIAESIYEEIKPLISIKN